MMTLDQIMRIIILGIVQGFTEWLPISSTGHLAVVEYFLGLRAPLLLDIALHVGTLLVVVIFVRNDIRSILSCLAHLDFRSKNGQMIRAVVASMIPTSLIGLLLLEPVETHFRGILCIAIAFMANGMILYCSKGTQKRMDRIGYVAALAIGAAQGIAIVPGISRSGATIGIALMLGIRRERAFKFSLLISIPAVMGTLVLTTYTGLNRLIVVGLDWTQILLGVIVSALAGYLGLRLLWRVLAKNSLHVLAIYCLSIGALLVLLSLHAS